MQPVVIEEELAVASLPTRPRNARILIAEAHPIGRNTLERACRCVATDVHVVASWRNFADVLDRLEELRLPPDLVILGDAFSNHSECEALIMRRFPSARVIHLPTRNDGSLLAARLLRQLDRAA